VASALAALLLSLPRSAVVAEDEADVPVTVAVVQDAPPFSYQIDDGDWRGLSIEMWKIIAAELHLQTRFVGMRRSELIDAVEGGQARFGIGPLSITAERLERVDFSAPIYATGIAIAVPYVPRGTAAVLLDAIASAAFLKLIGGLLILLVIVGTAFWIVERHRNPDFAAEIQGWGSGIWLSIVTMTTVGYGDKAPRTVAGRVVAAVWMFTSIILISIFTGTVATLLTVNQMGSRVERFHDLNGIRVAVIHGSAAEQLMQDRGIQTQHFADLTEALQALASDRADAFVYDRALLAAALKQHPELPITIRPGTLRVEYFAIAMVYGEPLRRPINRALAHLLDSRTWRRLRFDYLGSQETDS
jgi:ABC-type amino acid transport substrate-binding protein